jgi:hypothetical protein
MKMRNYYDNLFLNREELQIKDIQTHNFNQYLQSICNLKGM